MKKTKKKSKPPSNGKAILLTAVAIVALILLFKFVILGGSKSVNLANQGIDLLEKNQFFESEKRFAKALGIDPVLNFIEKSKNPALANIGLGNWALEKRDFIRAGELYQEAYRLDSTLDFERYLRYARNDFNYPEALYIELGNFFWEKNNLRLARLAYQRPLASNPDMPTALTNLGNIERRLGNNEEAVNYYNLALTSDPSSFEARVNMVSMAFINEEYSVFDFHLKKLQEYHPEHHYTIYFTGQYEKRRKNYADAVNFFKEFIEKYPDDPDSKLALIDCYVEMEEFDKAQELVRQLALKYGPTRQLYERALSPAEGAFKKGEYAKAKSYYESLDAIWPDDPEFKFGAANCMIRLDELDEARSIMEDLLQDHPKAPSLLTNLGIVYAKMGKTEWAREQFETAIALDSPPVAFYNLGRIYEKEGDSITANSLFITAAIKDPKAFGLEDYMMELKMQKAERIARGDTAGMIFLDK